MQIQFHLEGDAITVPAPFNITTVVRLVNVAAQLTRSDSTSTVATPASWDAPRDGCDNPRCFWRNVIAFSAIKFTHLHHR